MKYVELVPGVRSSVIGFGCSSVMGSVGKDRSLAAMELAFSLGINHFDTAPSYGYGESEGLLGTFLTGRRDKAVIATKYGIEVSRAAVVLGPLKAIVRPLVKMIRRSRSNSGPPGQPRVPVVSRNLHHRIPILAEGMEQSVHLSLKRLATDYIDLLFLHEPMLLERPDEVFSSAERLKKAGKIRGFGMASMVGDIAIHRSYVSQFDVLQFNCPSDPSEYEQIKADRGNVPNVLFSPFKANGLTSSGESKEGNGDPLAELRNDFSQSVVLCSMFSDSHIRQNAQSPDKERRQAS